MQNSDNTPKIMLHDTGLMSTNRIGTATHAHSDTSGVSFSFSNFPILLKNIAIKEITGRIKTDNSAAGKPTTSSTKDIDKPTIPITNVTFSMNCIGYVITQLCNKSIVTGNVHKHMTVFRHKNIF